MSFFPKYPIYVGIDRSSTSIKTASLRPTRKGWSILELKQHPLPQGNVNPLDNLPKEGVFISAINSKNVLVRRCEIHLKKEKDIFAVLDHQIEPLLPYPGEQAVIQSQIIEKKENGTALTAFSVRKDHLKQHLDELCVEPERVTCLPYALAAFSTLLPQTSIAAFLVYPGPEEVTCILVEKGKLLASRSFNRCEDLSREIEKTVLSFSATHKQKYFETIYLVSTDSLLLEQIQKASGKHVLLPSSTILNISQEELIRFAPAIGIALSGNGPDFRQKEFGFPHRWKRVAKPLCAYFIFASILIASIFSYGKLQLAHQKQAIEHAYLLLQNSEGKKIEAGNAPQTVSEYIDSLNSLEKEIQSKSDTFPLLPQVPQVKDLMAWLLSYPQLEIESFHYTMVKHPDLSRKKEHYKVKVDLEFSSQSQSAARSFHEMLAAPNAFVDPKEEVRWSTNKGKYRAVFYLKDKTRYM